MQSLHICTWISQVFLLACNTLHLGCQVHCLAPLAQPHAPDLAISHVQCTHGHASARAGCHKPAPLGAVPRRQQVHGCATDLLALRGQSLPACAVQMQGVLHTAEAGRSHQPFCAVQAHCRQSMASL